MQNLDMIGGLPVFLNIHTVSDDNSPHKDEIKLIFPQYFVFGVHF